MSEQEEERRRPRPEPTTGGAEEDELSMWDAYWDRFRRQQVDDPVEEQREGIWERFRRQQVDDPVTRRRARRKRPESP